MNEPVIIVAAIGLLAAPLASILTWLLNRKKDSLLGTSALVTASGDAVDAMKDALASVREELLHTKDALDKLKTQNEQLLDDNARLHAEMNRLRNLVEEAIRLRADDDLARTLLTILNPPQKEQR